MTTLQIALADLDPLPGGYCTENRLRNMRQYIGRRDTPIVVRRSSEAGRWRLIDGQHRAAVARELGEEVIFAITDDEEKN